MDDKVTQIAKLMEATPSEGLELNIRNFLLAGGVLLAYSPAQAVLEGDARLDVALPTDGAYTVRLYDSLYRAAGPGQFRLKIGQFHFACTDCHGQAANKWIRGQWLGEPKGQFDHFPLWRTSRNEVWDIRKRLQWCNVQVRANELPPDAVEYGELELYLRKMNEGQTLTAPNIRH